MYSEELEEDEQEQKNDNFIMNFYYNNKVLVWIFLGIVIFILLMSLLTKGGSNSGSGKEEIKVSIYPPEEEVTVAIGRSTNLIPSISTNQQVTFIWKVEDENIVKVDNGNVTGLNYGKTKVTVEYIHSDGKTYSADKMVKVADGEEGIQLNDVAFKNGDLFLPLNSTYQVKLVISPSSGYIESKTFTSSNTSVATVDSSGLITAVGEGEAVISLDVNGQYKDELNVYVDRSFSTAEIIITPSRISFDGELRKIKVGTTELLTYTVEPEDADRERLTWTSSDESVLTVDNHGRVTGIKEGQATVTVTALNGEKDKIDIDVESDIVPVSEIELTVSNVYLSTGQAQTITPIISPDNASNKALSYLSLDPAIASVEPNETGTQATITGVGAGTTTIVIKSSNDVEKRLEVVVTGSSGNSDSSSDEGSSGGGGGNSATIVVRVNGDRPTKSCEGQTLKYYNNPTVKITLNSGIGKIRYCYGTGKCTPNQEATSTTSFTIGGKGLYTLRIKKYDKSGNEIASSDSGNYYDGALEYYINTKGEGVTCSGSSESSSTTCSGISNVTTCNGTSGCSWCSGSCRKKEECKCCCTTGKTSCAWINGCTAAKPLLISGVTTENVCKNKEGSSTVTPSPSPKATANPNLKQPCCDIEHGITITNDFGCASCTTCISGRCNNSTTKPTTSPRVTTTPKPSTSPSLTCNRPTNLNVYVSGKATWTKSSNATEYQIRVAGGLWKSTTSNEINIYDALVGGSGDRKVELRAKCSGGKYSDIVSRTIKVYTLTLNKGTGISSVSGSTTCNSTAGKACNYIGNSTVEIDATVQNDYNFYKWYGTIPVTEGMHKVKITMNKNISLTAYAQKKVSSPSPTATAGPNSTPAAGGISFTDTSHISYRCNGANITIFTFNGYSPSGLHIDAKNLTYGTDYTCVCREDDRGFFAGTYIVYKCKGKGNYTGESDRFTCIGKKSDNPTNCSSWLTPTQTPTPTPKPAYRYDCNYIGDVTVNNSTNCENTNSLANNILDLEDWMLNNCRKGTCYGCVMNNPIMRYECKKNNN